MSAPPQPIPTKRCPKCHGTGRCHDCAGAGIVENDPFDPPIVVDDGEPKAKPPKVEVVRAAKDGKSGTVALGKKGNQIVIDVTFHEGHAVPPRGVEWPTEWAAPIEAAIRARK